MSVPPDPVGSYDAGKSAKKAGVETASSLASLIVPLLGALALEPTFRDAVSAALKDHPGMSAALPAIFIALRFGTKFYLDRQKHKDAAWHMEHGVEPDKAVELAVTSGADPQTAVADAVAEIKQEAKEAKL